MEQAQPTQIKTGNPGALVRVQPAQPPVEVEAYQRSPTLMTGDAAGAQGAVRVWAPNRKILWTTCLGSGLGGLALTSLYLIPHVGGSFGYWLGWLWAAFFYSARALRRPCYLTTDDAGIGVTTNTGSRALHWQDIRSARKRKSSSAYEYPRLYLQTPDRVEINLTGYPAAQQGELLSLITMRARLQPHPARKELYVSSGRALPEAEALLDDDEICGLVMEGRRKEAQRLASSRHGMKAKEAAAAIDALDLSLSLLRPGEVLERRLPDPNMRSELLGLVRGGYSRRAARLYRGRYQTSRLVASETIQLLQSGAALPPGAGGDRLQR